MAKTNTPPSRWDKFWENVSTAPVVNFFTNSVVILISVGILLIIIGVTGFISNLLASSLEYYKPSIDNILRTIGTAILGGGVFTALVQSQRFTEVYKKVFEDALWKPDFLKKRGDIREVWNNVSRVLYQEKFPDLSSEIEEIITTEYFPTNHKFYVEKYDLTITLINKNEHFIEHVEYLNVVLKPAKNETDLNYCFRSLINFPPLIEGVEDETDLHIEELIVNGQTMPVDDKIFTKSKTNSQHLFDFNLPLQLAGEHNIILKRKKTLERSSNKDKRFFARYFQKDVTVTVIAPIGINIDLFSMGTVNNFIKSSEQVNNGLKILKYYYNGLILPKQGFFILVN